MMKRQGGFSLIEMLMVVAILAMGLAVMAVPSFLAYRDNTNLRNAADSFAGDIYQLRQRAMAEYRVYQIVFTVPDTYDIQRCNATGANCGGAFVMDGSRSLATGSGTKVDTQSFPGGTITFQPRGTASPGTLELINDRGSEIHVIVNITGRPSVDVIQLN